MTSVAVAAVHELSGTAAAHRPASLYVAMPRLDRGPIDLLAEIAQDKLQPNVRATNAVLTSRKPRASNKKRRDRPVVAPTIRQRLL
ncbi:MAG: hypothetical protein ACRDPG_00015, partial [Nocardioidaceae bacterium]